MAKGRAEWCPFPERAIGDTSLSRLDLRVLAAIAFYDRLGSNGQGATASRATMARHVCCAPTNFSTAVSHLIERGYVRKDAHPKDARKVCLRVIYGTENRYSPQYRNQEDRSSIQDQNRYGSEYLSSGDRSSPRYVIGRVNFENSVSDQLVSHSNKKEYKEHRAHARAKRNVEKFTQQVRADFVCLRRAELHALAEALQSDPATLTTEYLNDKIVWFRSFPRHLPGHPDIIEQASLLIAEMKSVIETRGAN